MNRIPLSESQWAAGRELLEGCTPTQGRVAAALGVNPTTVATKSAQEGWEGLDFRKMEVRHAHEAFLRTVRRLAGAGVANGSDCEDDHAGAEPAGTETLPHIDGDEEPQTLVTRMGGMLASRASALMREAATGRPLQPRQVALLSSMVQLAERIAGLPQPDLAAKKEAERESFAAFAVRVDQQIIRFARHYAVQALLRDGRMSEERANELLNEPAEKIQSILPRDDEDL